MTHENTRTLRFLRRADTLAAAVIHDFIPRDRDGYLPTPESRIDWLLRMRRLRSFDIFFPVSEFSGTRLQELIGTPSESVHVTGACVRASLYPSRKPGRGPAENRFNDYGRRPYFLTVGGDDRRKNTETAAAAVSQLARRTGNSPRLLVLSLFEPVYRDDVSRSGETVLGQSVVEFLPDLCDEDLREAYAGSEAVIAPSIIEGFSLPIVEAIVNGAPVIASDCDAQRELIGNPDALFPADAPAALADRLEHLQRSPELRNRLRKEQANIAAQFHEEAVAGRLWGPLWNRFTSLTHGFAPSVSRGLKPRVAFVTPYPPDRSGVASYTAQTLAAAKNHFELDLFTDAPRPVVTPDGIRDQGNIGPKPYIDRRYDAVVSVLGNSRVHAPIFREYERYGGSCILHDPRLTEIYHDRLGRFGLKRMAERILNRHVSDAEVESWLGGEQSPTQFIEDVVDRATPLVVHSDQFRQLIEERRGVSAHVAPFCPNLHFTEEECSPCSRGLARGRLGLSSEAFVISSFGHVDLLRKGVSHCVMALALLRAWGAPAELHLVGQIHNDDRAKLESLSERFDVARWVRVVDRFVDDRMYRDYLLGSDAAVQLCSQGLGQASTALADAISAGLPCVAERNLAPACGPPDYVRTAPPVPSHLLIAEALFEIFRQGGKRTWEQERQQYLAAHNFRVYADRLAEILRLS